MVEVYATALVLMVLVFLSCLVKAADEKYFATKSIWIFIWFLFSVLFFSMAATRVGGSDWVNYKSLFNTISYSTSFGEALSENRLIEPGYVALNHFVAWVGGSRRDVVYIKSAITAFGIFLLSSAWRFNHCCMAFYRGNASKANCGDCYCNDYFYDRIQ